ncbi:alpha/beta fold hydrolase [Ramlibacter sp. MAHUQ-53]|uniref:alpha/beta fold hydrolase n=1 Tax=unclassified Ramlibacter TaxID=2617605 RepID=UPI00363640B9
MSTTPQPFEIETSDPGVRIVGRIRGSGPPLLLLHGNPLTQMSWDRIAPRLAEHFTVVTTDLRGYGDSGKPEGLPDHSNYTFRRMAQDQVEVMQHLGFARFGVTGHDRGARTAFRMAMDHPDKVTRVAFLDILPTHCVFKDIQVQMALDLYHWWFMAQKRGFPETLLRGNEAFYIRDKLMKQGPGKGGFTEEEITEYIRVCTPENIHAVCEDYRAAATLDLQMDTADFEAGRKVQPPALVLWGEKSHTAHHHDARIEWPKYCANIVRMQELPCGHYPTEQAPEHTLAELLAFFKE